MENFSAVAILGLVLAVAGGISTLGNAANWLVKLVQVIKAPNAEQNSRLDKLEQRVDAHDGFLASDKERLDSTEEDTRIMLRSLLALLSHGIDGNHQKQMEEARDDLQNHLINHK